MSSLVDKSNKESLKQPLFAKVSEHILNEIEIAQKKRQPRKLYPRVHKNPEHSIFNEVGQFFDPKTIEFNWDQINELFKDNQKINTLNKNQMALINSMIEEQLSETVNLKVQYSEDMFMPNQFANGENTQEVSLDKGQQIIKNNKRDQMQLLLAVLENSDFLKTLKSQLRKLDDVKKAGRRPNEYGILTEEELADKNFYLDKFIEKVMYFEEKIYIVLQYTLKSKNLNRIDYKFKVFEYNYESKQVELIFKGSIHDSIPFEFDVKPHQDVIIQDGENLQYCVFEEKKEKDLDLNVAEIPPRQFLKQFSLKTWEETTVKEFTSLNSKENQIFFAIWFVQTNDFLSISNQKCQYLVRDSKITNTKRFLMLNMIKLAEFDYIYDIRDLDDIAKSQKTIDADENKHELSDFYGIQYNVDDTIYLNIFSVMGENDQFKCNGQDLVQVFGDDIDKETNEKFNLLKKVIQETRSLKKICINEDGETFTLYKSDRLMLNKFRLLMECLVGATSNLSFDVVLDDINRKVLIIMRSEQDNEIKMLPFSNQAYILQVDMFSAFQQIPTDMPTPIINKDQFTFSKQIRNVAVNSNYQQIIINDTQYNYDGHECIPTHFKTKFIQQQKIVKGKKEITDLEDDQVAFLSNEGYFLMYNKEGELTPYSITLNTKNYINNCVVPQIEEKEVDQKIETQQELEERLFLEQQKEEEEAIKRAIQEKNEAQKKQEIDQNIEVKCAKDHYLVKHVGQVPEYAGLGSPRCDICAQVNLDKHKVFYRCITCQFDCCIACTYMRCEPPILKQMMYTGAHNCIMTRRGANVNSGWACDGRKLGKGCLSGISAFHQTEHIQGYRCQKCDFDLCMMCMYKYKKPIKDNSTAYKSLSLKCKEDHSMKSVSGIPKAYVGRLKSVSCENCYQNNIDKHELYYRCKECEYDICLSCSLNRCTPKILIEKMNIILFQFEIQVMPPNFMKRWICKGTESKKGCDQVLEYHDQTEFVQGYWNEENDFTLCLKCVIKFKKPILAVYEQLDIQCDNGHKLDKHKGRVKEYGGGTPRCDICSQSDLHMHELFYRCPTCQFDCCLSCSLGKSTPQHFQDLMFSKVHECAMQKKYPNQNTGWACDARDIGAGCQSGITDFSQTQYIQGFNCSKCDFDLCVKCILKYKKEIRIETDLQNMTIQCEKQHQMVKASGNPYNNNATVFCDGCKRRNIELCPYFYRCGDCSMDICLQCSFDRCEENKSIVEKARLLNTSKLDTSNVKSTMMSFKKKNSGHLRKADGKIARQLKKTPLQLEIEAKLPFVFKTIENLEKQNLKRCFLTSLSQQFKENEMNEVPMMVQNENNHGVFILLIDLRNRKLIQTLQLDIEWEEYSAITRSNMIYSSELYILESTRAKTVYSQNYHAALHQTSVKRLVMFEFRIDWSFVGQAPMETKITFISKSVFITRDITFNHETFCSSLTDDNMVIQGVKINFEFEGNLVSLDLHNNQLKEEKIKTIDNEFTMTRYKKFFNDQNIMVAVCVQAKLKDSIVASDYFTEFEKNRFIRQSIKTCLNMLQFDFFDFIERSVLIKDKFQGVESFQGMNSLDLYYQKPQQIKKMIARLQYEHQKGNIGSLLQLLFEDDKNYERIDKYRGAGLMRTKGDISYDFCYFEILERCLMDKNIQLVTADIVISFLFKQEYNPNTQRLFVMLMPAFLECPLKSRQYFNFLGVDDDLEGEEKENTKRLLLEIECQHSERLPQFSNDNLYLQAKNFYGLNPVMSVNNLVEDLIINGKNVISSDFEIRHYYIELRNLIWHEKLRNIQYKKGEVEITMNDFYIADLMCKVIKKTGSNIQDQPTIRNIIDQQFEISNTYFLTLMFLYISTVMAPFFVQLLTADWMTVVICNCIQMISACYFLYLEFQQMKDQGNEYLNEIWNMFDFLGFIFITLHFMLRMSTLQHNITIIHNQDNEHADIVGDQYTHILFALKILSVLILVQSFMKVMFFLRVNADFGLLVQLVGQCISDVQQFGGFLIVWIVFFTVQSLILGMRVEKDDYDGLGFKIRALIQMYRNSIGDISPPKYDLYLDTEKNITSSENTLMISMIWLVWFFNQLFILIILLNFLIAIISQSYEQVMSQSTVNKYIHRADLNRECRLLMSHTLNPIELLIYSAQKDYDNGEDWTGFVTSLKNFVRDQNTIVKDKLVILRHMLSSQIHHQNMKQDKVNQQMMEKIDAMATQITAISIVKTEDPTEKILKAIQEQTVILKKEVQKGNGNENESDDKDEY